jgi:hypothetical protein
MFPARCQKATGQPRRAPWRSRRREIRSNIQRHGSRFLRGRVPGRSCAGGGIPEPRMWKQTQQLYWSIQALPGHARCASQTASQADPSTASSFRACRPEVHHTCQRLDGAGHGVRNIPAARAARPQGERPEVGQERHSQAQGCQSGPVCCAGEAQAPAPPPAAPRANTRSVRSAPHGVELAPCILRAWHARGANPRQLHPLCFDPGTACTGSAACRPNQRACMPRWPGCLHAAAQSPLSETCSLREFSMEHTAAYVPLDTATIAHAICVHVCTARWNPHAFFPL